jgi:hypothetical protein
VKAKGGMGILVFKPIEIEQLIGKVRLSAEQCEQAYVAWKEQQAHWLISSQNDIGSLLSTLCSREEPEPDIPARPPVLARTDLVDPRAGDDEALALTEQYGSSAATEYMRKNPNFRNMFT